MASNSRPEDGIVIRIDYEYNNDGVKKAIHDVETLSNNTEEGLAHINKIFSGLSEVFNKVSPSLDKGNEKIRKLVSSYENAQRAAQNAQRNFSKASINWAENKLSGKDTAKNAIAVKNAYNTYISATTRARDSLINLLTAQTKLDKTVVSESDPMADLNKELGLTAEQQEIIAKGQKKIKLSDIADGVDKIGKKIKKLDLQSLVAKIFVIRRAWQQLLRFTEASSSWVENLNLLEVVFADTTDEAKNFVKMASDNFGLDANALAQYVSTFKQMANAMGQVATTGTEMAEALTYLALDISSLRNVDLKTAASDLASGIAGQVKPVRKYGFDITKTSIDELLKELGGGSSSTLTQANKQLARTILLIRQSKDAWGDMAKTINTFANQQRVMNDQWETTKRLLGTVLVGTFQVGDTLEEANKTAGIATKTIWYINGGLLALNEVLSVIVPQAESVNGAIGTGAEEAADAYEDLEDAVSGSLASFDKFNTLSSGSGSIDLTGGLTQLFSKEYSEYMNKFKQSMADINMYSKEIADNFLKAFFPSFSEWQKDNPAGTFADWADVSGEVKLNVAELGKSMFGIVATVLSIKSPLLAIFAAIAKNAILDPEKLQNLISIGTDLTQTLVEISTTVADIVEEVAPFVLALLRAAAAVTTFLDKTGLLIPTLVLLGSAFVGIKLSLFIWKLEESFGLVTKLSAKFDEMRMKSKNAFNSMYKDVGKFNGALKDTHNQITMANVAVGMLAMALTYAISDSIIGQFEGESKTIVSSIFLIVGALTALITAAVAAKTALSWGTALPIILAGLGAAMAGVKGLIDSNIPKHADGGFQKGGLFYAGEKGAEWVGRQGNTSTIVNDAQMSDIMRDSVAQGVMQANIATRTTSQKQRPIVLNVDGKKFLEIVESEASKNGKELARVK